MDQLPHDDTNPDTYSAVVPLETEPQRRHSVIDTVLDPEARPYRWLLLSIFVASFIDGTLTLMEIGWGAAQEGNPILKALFEASPWLAVAFKLGVSAGIIAMMWYSRESRLIRVIALGTLMLYAAVLAFHFGNLVGFQYFTPV